MRLRPLALAALPLVLLAATACSPKNQNTTAPRACVAAQLPVKTPGKLTIGTDSPAYDPWFSKDDPTNGKGFESAVAYAVAKQLGFAPSAVQWIKVPFNNSYVAGPKKFDFDINQISINPDREKAVDFSDGYYSAAQAVIVLDKNKPAVASIADLKKLKLGAQTGTTSLTVIRDEIKPTADPVVFTTTNVAKRALLNGQVDGIVADLPTALYITAAEIKGSTILGQFPSTAGTPEQFGLLTQKGSGLVGCLDKALASLKADGTLADLEKQWLSDTISVPVLK
jgi:polar amino acid transport system substrate-binding protein